MRKKLNTNRTLEYKILLFIQGLVICERFLNLLQYSLCELVYVPHGTIRECAKILLLFFWGGLDNLFISNLEPRVPI